ncbi:MAG: hypothetical protein ACI9US_002607, partial [Gammaproteobacteria bacterium]
SSILQCSLRARRPLAVEFNALKQFNTIELFVGSGKPTPNIP